MKKRKIIISIILLTTIVVSALNVSFKSLSANAAEALSNANASGTVTVTASKLVANSTSTTVMKNNTSYLQQYINDVSSSGGGKVKIPSGTYYFSPTTEIIRNISQYVIKCKNNVIVEGAGTSTILKPYAPNNKYPVDMFYYNEYADSNGTNKTYLNNADFKNFVIDGEKAYATQYNSAGKGFMINLFKNCDWENVTVKNTDGTGFGVDCPLSSTIKNCTATNCGKRGYLIGTSAPGASGFGIGTGYSNSEAITITNCTATGNYKYGFFFEHQGRFNNNDGLYKATKAKGFVVSNCTAKGNRYDFGGERANDVTYQNCVSEKSSANVSAIHFENKSVRTKVVNCTVKQTFTDVSDSSKYYYTPVYWALNSSITDGISKTTFGPTKETTRAQAIVFIYRMAGRPGSVVYSSGDKLNKQFETGYKDVPSDSYYVDAVKWAKEEGIISAGTTFSPNDGCTRAQFITMLWRYAGSPTVTTKNKFTDVSSGSYYEAAVNWAVSKGIVNGTSGSKFSPNNVITRADAVTMLYRYAK